MSSKDSKPKKKQEATPEKEEKETKQGGGGGSKISLAKLEKSITKATGDKLADL
jgi:hypothetical protein